MVDLSSRRVSFKKRMKLAFKRGVRDVFRNYGRSLLIILTIAIGIALAIGIITAINGVDDKVIGLLHANVLPPSFNLKQINDALDQGRSLLTYLAYFFSGSFVAMVTWVSMEKRRYSISAARAKGIKTSDKMIEYLVESVILCILGGLAGIGLGYELCQFIPQAFPLVPMHFQWSDVWHVFPQISGFSFLVTSCLTFLLALRPNATPEL